MFDLYKAKQKELFPFKKHTIQNKQLHPFSLLFLKKKKIVQVPLQLMFEVLETHLYYINVLLPP